MLNRNLDKNLRKAIKRRGFKLALFPIEYLNIGYSTFNYRLKNDCFLVSDINKCIEILGVSYDELMQKPKDLRIRNTVPEHVKPKLIKVSMPEIPTEPTKEPTKEVKPVIKKEHKHGSSDVSDFIKRLTV